MTKMWKKEGERKINDWLGRTQEHRVKLIFECYKFVGTNVIHEIEKKTIMVDKPSVTGKMFIYDLSIKGDC